MDVSITFIVLSHTMVALEGSLTRRDTEFILGASIASLSVVI